MLPFNLVEVLGGLFPLVIVELLRAGRVEQLHRPLLIRQVLLGLAVAQRGAAAQREGARGGGEDEETDGTERHG